MEPVGCEPSPGVRTANPKHVAITVVKRNPKFDQVVYLGVEIHKVLVVRRHGHLSAKFS